LAETCTEHRWFVEGFVCRICGRAADPASGQISLLVCGHPDCVSLSNSMCDHIHPCGHACVGIRGETAHPVCPECNISGSICPKCERDLWGSICLTLECGHTIHKNCAIEIIRQPRAAGRLILPICPAVGCGAFVRHPILREECAADATDWDLIEALVNKVATKRILAEGIDYHPEVSDARSHHIFTTKDKVYNVK
jgi:hypothetical protein